MRSHLVIVNPPVLDDLLSFGDIAEPMFIQAFISELSVEAFDTPVLLGLSRLDKIEWNAVFIRPLIEYMPSEIRSIAHDQSPRFPAKIDQAVQDCKGKPDTNLKLSVSKQGRRVTSEAFASVLKNDNARHDTPDRVPGMWGVNAGAHHLLLRFTCAPHQMDHPVRAGTSLRDVDQGCGPIHWTALGNGQKYREGLAGEEVQEGVHLGEVEVLGIDEVYLGKVMGYITRQAYGYHDEKYLHLKIYYGINLIRIG